ncbi:MAG: SpoIID/LytB domain-containing protein [Actinomycetes bacterium]|tara:strand:- start:77 stop:1252 length:1176 start_codon:yes stop_codon:yes gene_type:complete
MKRALALSVLITLTSLSNASAAAPKSFIFIGSGYGHGVGLSQYGAKGQALEGKSAIEILNHYFPNSEVTPVEDTATISVNIAHQVSALSLVLPITDSATVAVDTAVANSLPEDSEINFAISGKLITGPGGIGKLWVVKWNNPQSVISVNYGKTKFRINHGYLRLKAVKVRGVGFRIEATNLLRLHDEYLYGIAEVPSSWPEAALQSQVIASRTYALMRMNSIKKACDCHVYNSKYDQAFVGYSKEGERGYGQFWKAAVDATAVDEGHGLAITVDQLPVSVFFSSSSGGMTQRPVDVWGTDIPHLVSVIDSWSIDPAINKNYASWRKKVSQRVMSKALGLVDVIELRLGARTATNSVLNVTGISSDGKSITLPVGTFKSAVKLPSSWFALKN